jgi:hypothetical protein
MAGEKKETTAYTAIVSFFDISALSRSAALSVLSLQQCKTTDNQRQKSKA